MLLTEYWYWESIEMYRKLFLCAVIQFISPGSPSQILVAIVFTVFFSAFFSFSSPYINAGDDLFSVIAQLQIFVVALAGLLIKADLTNAEGYDPELFDMMLTILTIFPLVLLGVSMILEHCCSMSSTEAFDEIKQEFPGTTTSLAEYTFGGGERLVKRRYAENDTAIETQIPRLHQTLQSLRFIFDRNKAVQRYTYISDEIEQCVHRIGYEIARRCANPENTHEEHEHLKKMSSVIGAICTKYGRLLLAVLSAQKEDHGRKISKDMAMPRRAFLNTLNKALQDPFFLRYCIDPTSQSSKKEPTSADPASVAPRRTRAGMQTAAATKIQALFRSRSARRAWCAGASVSKMAGFKKALLLIRGVNAFTTVKTVTTAQLDFLFKLSRTRLIFVLSRLCSSEPLANFDNAVQNVKPPRDTLPSSLPSHTMKESKYHAIESKNHAIESKNHIEVEMVDIQVQTGSPFVQSNKQFLSGAGHTCVEVHTDVLEGDAPGSRLTFSRKRPVTPPQADEVTPSQADEVAPSQADEVYADASKEGEA